MFASVCASQNVVSPEVHGDRRVTFRLRAPATNDVKLWGEWIHKFNTLEPMRKGADGIWTATIGPLEPGIYTYTFVIDRLGVPDPGNHLRAGDDGSLVEVPGEAAALYDPQAVPHGAVHLISYEGKLRHGVRRVVVWTPPLYEREARSRYPILYLLHGAGDTEFTWTHVGRAHYIMDNLVALGRARPMILVMPNGSGDSFERELIEEVLPLVESRYRVKRGARNRAVAGVSMGGYQALATASKHAEMFGSFGVFGAGAHGEASDGSVRQFAAARNKLPPGTGIFRIAIGDQDPLLADATRLSRLLNEGRVIHELKISPGEGHTWLLWRKCLADFVPALFNF